MRRRAWRGVSVAVAAARLVLLAACGCVRFALFHPIRCWVTRTIRRRLIGRWRLTGRVLRRFAPPLVARSRPRLLMARWMRLRVAGRLVRLVVSGAVSVAGARMAADSHRLAALLRVARLRVASHPHLLRVVCLGLARLAVPLVALQCLCCLVCRLAVCRGPFPLAVPPVAPRRVRRPLGVPVVPVVARLCVAACVVSERLLAICWYWLLLCSLSCAGGVGEGVC